MLSQSITSILTVLLFLCTTSASSDTVSNSSRFFKWSALIIPQFDNITLNGSTYCNGGYIGIKHVLTTGPCVFGVSRLRVKLGPHYAQYGVDVYKLEFVYDKININTGRNRAYSYDNKLSLIRLDEDPQYPGGTYIQPLILPPEPTLFQLNDALDTNFTAVEAGYILNEDGIFEQQWVDVILLDFYDCCSAFPSINIHKELCSAGENGEKKRHLCPRIGNPLVTGARTIIGIGTLETCVENGPQTFARINDYRGWISIICKI